MNPEKCKYAGKCGWSCYGTYCKITDPKNYEHCDLYMGFDGTTNRALKELGKRYREGLERQRGKYLDLNDLIDEKIKPTGRDDG